MPTQMKNPFVGMTRSWIMARRNEAMQRIEDGMGEYKVLIRGNVGDKGFENEISVTALQMLSWANDALRLMDGDRVTRTKADFRC